MAKKVEHPNLDFFKNLSKGDKAFEDKMTKIFKKEFFEDIKFYKDALNKKDYKRAINFVHRLKHKVGLVGLEKSYKLTDSYEKNLKNQILSLEAEFDSILKTISVFLEKID